MLRPNNASKSSIRLLVFRSSVLERNWRQNMPSLFSYITESPVEVTLLFGAIFLTMYLLYRRHNVGDGGRKLPPAMPSLPIVGSLPFLPTKMQDLAEFCISPRNKLGKIFSLRLGSKWVAVTLFAKNCIAVLTILTAVSSCVWRDWRLWSVWTEH